MAATFNKKHMHCTHSQTLRMISQRIVLFITVFPVLILAGCGSQPEMDTDIEETEAVYFEVIGQGATSSFTDTTQVVVMDQDSWNNYEQYMKTVIPFPEIDFSQLMVVLVAVPVPEQGVSIQVQSVERMAGNAVVSYQMGYPGKDCRGSDQPSTPFQVIMLPKVEANYTFEHFIEEYHCTL